MSGIEWIVDAHGCSSESLSNPVRLSELFERIISSMKLRPVGPAQWHQFPNTGGITGLCLLAESHLACHTFPEFGSLCLNLFCCVPREPWEFEPALISMFGATSVTICTMTRSYSSGQGLHFPSGRDGLPLENHG